jgi:hypothetical protein
MARALKSAVAEATSTDFRSVMPQGQLCFRLADNQTACECSWTHQSQGTRLPISLCLQGSNSMDRDRARCASYHIHNLLSA